MFLAMGGIGPRARGQLAAGTPGPLGCVVSARGSGSPANSRVGTGKDTTTSRSETRGPREPPTSDHGLLTHGSNAPLLGRATAVVRQRGDVLDRLDVEPV